MTDSSWADSWGFRDWDLGFVCLSIWDRWSLWALGKLDLLNRLGSDGFRQTQLWQGLILQQISLWWLDISCNNLSWHADGWMGKRIAYLEAVHILSLCSEKTGKGIRDMILWSRTSALSKLGMISCQVFVWCCKSVWKWCRLARR